MHTVLNAVLHTLLHSAMHSPQLHTGDTATRSPVTPGGIGYAQPYRIFLGTGESLQPGHHKQIYNFCRIFFSAYSLYKRKVIKKQKSAL